MRAFPRWSVGTIKFHNIIFYIGTQSVPGCIPTPERHCH